MNPTENRLARLELLISEQNADIAALSVLLRAFIVVVPNRAVLREAYQVLEADYQTGLRESGFEAGHDPERVGNLLRQVQDRLNIWRDQLDID